MMTMKKMLMMTKPRESSRTRPVRSVVMRASILCLALATVCLAFAGTASARSEPAAALALPYWTSQSTDTAVNLVNNSDIQRVLRIIAISGDPGTAYESRSFACRLPPRGSTSVEITNSAGSIEMTALCDPDVSATTVVTPIPGSRGVIFVAIEDTAGRTVSTNAIYGESTVVDSVNGFAWSTDAISYKAGTRAGLEQNDGDRTYRFDDGEYERNAAGARLDYEALSLTTEVFPKLVLFNPDGTTGQPAPTAQLNIFFYNAEAVVRNASHTFSGFDYVLLTDIDPNFQDVFLDSPNGWLGYTSAPVNQASQHDQQPSLGDANQIRRAPVLAWLLRDATLPISSAARRSIPIETPLVPIEDDAFPALRLLEDADGDGIEDPIDTMPGSGSSAFDDAPFGGVTNGTITTLGDQSLRIGRGGNVDAIQMETLLTGGAAPAMLDVCGGIAQLAITSGSYATYTCGSVDLSVELGLVQILFELGGEPASIDVGAGNSVIVDPETGAIIADPDNPDPIVVETAGGSVEIQPGETVLLGVEIEILHKPYARWWWWFRPHIWVAVLGSDTLDVGDVVEDSLALGPAGVGPRKLKKRDVDRDGEKDLLGRYRLRDSGIDLHTDEEACLQGEVETDNGTFPFLACDTLLREPPPKPWWAWW